MYSILKLFSVISIIIMATEGLPLKCVQIHNNDNEMSNEILNTYESGVNNQLYKNSILKFLKVLGEKKVKQIYADIISGSHSADTALTCDTCELILSLAKISVYSPSELYYIMGGICQSFHVEDKRVCDGLSDLFAGEAYFILKNTNLTRSEICGILVGVECLSDPCAKHDEWTINFEDKSVGYSLEEKIDEKVIYSVQYFSLNKHQTYNVLQLSDIHIDPFYNPGASSDCGEPLCCRQTSKDGKGKAGYWGDYFSCDSPKYTIEQLLSHINTTLTDEYQYIIWTGDMVAHDVWNTTKDTIINGSRSLTSMVKKYIANGKLVFPVVGNHEGLPVNQFAPPEITGDLSIGWLYSELFNQWSQWIPVQYANTFKSYGYYANNVSPNLRVIVLNTNYCAKLNFWLTYNPYDPADQLKWLAEQLSDAESLSQSVHIVGHIPPDNTQCIPQWVHNYLILVEKYNQTIKAQFFGHTHFDEVRLLYAPTNKSNPVGVAYLAPSVTTYESVNPSFRFYTIDSKGSVLDHKTYYMNLTDANINYNISSLEWIEEYSAKESYNMSSLVPNEWHRIYKTMNTDDKLFLSYYNHYHRYSGAFNHDFNDKLKKRLLGAIPVFDPIYCK